MTLQEDQTTEINTNNKAMVAVCDILGFGNLVKNKSLAEIVDYHIKNFRAALGSSIPKYENPAQSATMDEILRFF